MIFEVDEVADGESGEAWLRAMVLVDLLSMAIVLLMRLVCC